eukprot:CAMPEP_0168380784 /NCGR_PEP_ID=MMETSP0228-20121227/12540_1 /TAXON_ID=133427 /ORGANISM="Protoceratium reticulatum, Strain CCCM 535 (=CCMP 1889)" /LENGTH=252 /DNA_ID=CAMNT_0008393863 /DNA_START=45 /DNA_END=803 /DNA_ORIENTATION=+
MSRTAHGATVTTHLPVIPTAAWSASGGVDNRRRAEDSALRMLTQRADNLAMHISIPGHAGNAASGADHDPPAAGIQYMDWDRLLWLRQQLHQMKGGDARVARISAMTKTIDDLQHADEGAASSRMPSSWLRAPRAAKGLFSGARALAATMAGARQRKQPVSWALARVQPLHRDIPASKERAGADVWPAPCGGTPERDHGGVSLFRADFFAWPPEAPALGSISIDELFVGMDCGANTVLDCSSDDDGATSGLL